MTKSNLHYEKKFAYVYVCVRSDVQEEKRVIKGLRTAGSQGRENLLQVALNLI